MRILVAEDDEALRRRLVSILIASSYVIDEAANGEDAEYLGESGDYAAIVLDLGLPGRDGLTVLRHWRAAGVNAPVLVLTARDTWRDRVEGLRSGADDYLGKPFEGEELLARIEALIRRSRGRAGATVRLGEVEIDPARRLVRHRGEDVTLTALEFRTLHYLGANAGRVVSQAELMEHIYSQDAEHGSNVVEVVISRLRRKIAPGVIETRRGLGYVAPAG
jgi:two-component system OmpR family response regulator